MEEPICRGILARRSEVERADQGEEDRDVHLPGDDPRGEGAGGDDPAWQEDQSRAKTWSGEQGRNRGPDQAQELGRSEGIEDLPEEAEVAGKGASWFRRFHGSFQCARTMAVNPEAQLFLDAESDIAPAAPLEFLQAA